jgi:hypothetical protein
MNTDMTLAKRARLADLQQWYEDLEELLEDSSLSPDARLKIYEMQRELIHAMNVETGQIQQ